jgi:predicted AlkP superfamily pyrophosphatase or phosphodiesterase
MAQQLRPRVLAIGVDGMRPDALATAKTSHFDRLIREGAYLIDTQILSDRYENSDTSSGPGWSSILTGVWADKHGVNDNSFQGKNYEQFPHFFVRLKEVKPDATTASFVNWVPIEDHIVEGADVHRAYHPEGDAKYEDADRKVAADAMKHIDQHVPDATFVYFGQIDETGHSYGFHPTVKEYVEAIERVDAHVGQLLQSVDKHRDGNDWLILVTTDHGGEGTGHGGGHQQPTVRNVFLIVSEAAAVAGKLEQPSYLVDYPVTALTHLGVKLKDEWKLDGRAVGLRE